VSNNRRDRNTRQLEIQRIRDALKDLRERDPANYAAASVHLLHELNRLEKAKQPYAIT
jgi:hypothetical protein